MEVHPAYAVVLDEEGRFLKAANLRYQVGDTVRDIVELRRPKGKTPRPVEAPVRRCRPGRLPVHRVLWLLPAQLRPLRRPAHARSTRMWSCTLSRTDRVLELEGLNADGQVLIEGYDYEGQGSGGRDGGAGGAGHRYGATSLDGETGRPSRLPAPTPTGRPGRSRRPGRIWRSGTGRPL